MHPTEALIRRYYEAFNKGDRTAMLALLHDQVAHDPNQGTRRIGKPAFTQFLARMDGAYAEQLEDITVMVDATGTRAAAEFTVVGRYLRTDEGLPEARGQTYRIPAGAFLAVEGALITRITTYYNLEDWIAQVSA
ncbi:MAG: nuclear transport factor 2 family protein [Roseomonas sp.]|nr:nuclear transport factor 2 family protein [Roseomonas sp.]